MSGLNYPLLKLLSTFSGPDWLGLEKFLLSPCFNHRQDVIDLAAFLRSELEQGRFPDKKKMHEAIFPKQPYDDKAIRYIKSFLFQLAKQYLVQGELEDEQAFQDMLLLRALRKRNLSHTFGIEWRRALKKLDKQPYRHADYHFYKSRLFHEDYEASVGNRREQVRSFRELSDEMTVFFLAHKLRLSCTAITLKHVSETEIQQELLEEVLRIMEQGDYLRFPAVAVYYHAYKALTEADSQAHYESLKAILESGYAQFPNTELRDIYVLAINYCIRQINTGKRDFLKEVFWLYQTGLERDVFLEHGVLSRFTYNNILLTGIGLGAFEWTEEFLESYKDRIETEYQRDTYAYNKALLQYHRGDQDAAMQLLREVRFDDLLHQVQARVLLAKIYYEKEEWKALDSLLDSLRYFVYRHRRLGYHQKLYLNFVRMLKKLVSLQRYDKRAVTALQEEISQTNPLAERRWLDARC